MVKLDVCHLRVYIILTKRITIHERKKRYERETKDVKSSDKSVLVMSIKPRVSIEAVANEAMTY